MNRALEYIFYYIRSPDMGGYGRIWGDMGGYRGILHDTAGYSGIQRDTSGYSGIQQDMGDTAGYSGIQRDTHLETVGYRKMYSRARVHIWGPDIMKNILQSTGV
jgi:hypothetical protein